MITLADPVIYAKGVCLKMNSEESEKQNRKVGAKRMPHDEIWFAVFQGQCLYMFVVVHKKLACRQTQSPTCLDKRSTSSGMLLRAVWQWVCHDRNLWRMVQVCHPNFVGLKLFQPFPASNHHLLERREIRRRPWPWSHRGASGVPGDL